MLSFNDKKKTFVKKVDHSDLGTYGEWISNDIISSENALYESSEEK